MDLIHIIVSRTVLAMRQDDGQGLTEYAMILTLLAVTTIAALHFLGGRVTSELSNVGSSV